MPSITVEEALRVIAKKAAAVRFLSDVAALSKSPDTAVLSSIGSMCGEIESLTRRITATLTVEVLSAALAKG